MRPNNFQCFQLETSFLSLHPYTPEAKAEQEAADAAAEQASKDARKNQPAEAQKKKIYKGSK